MILKDEVAFKTFVELIDNLYDEIFIWDENRRVVYANKACYRHYGMQPQDFVGKTLEDFTEKERLWTPTCVPNTFEEKKPVIQRQKTFLGIGITTISVPIFDEANNVKYVVQSVRDDERDLFKELSPIQGIMEEGVFVEERMIYKSQAMKNVMEDSKKVAKTKAPILILGETGTGKSLMAKYIHDHSKRKEKPFVGINMASLSPSVIESEFFGYKKGAFTGANKEGKKGLFEMANGGTLFLDEIGDFPYELQAKFLHVLQDEEVIPVGGYVPIKLDIRIICATNCDLRKMVEVGKFRKDLYHRLNIFEITIPPIRGRRDDLLLLTSHFLNVFNKKYEKNVSCSEGVIESFLKYTWSGNVRELSNVVERGVITTEGGFIEVSDLPESFFSIDHIKKSSACVLEHMTFDAALELYEKKLILLAYEKHKTSRKVAEALSLSQSKASRLIRKHCEGWED